MFERASTIIRDGSKLDYAYVPANLVHREEQMARLEMLFRPLAESGRPCTAFLTGSVGTGKTVTATRFSMDLADYMAKAGRPIDTVYVNWRCCRSSGTTTGGSRTGGSRPTRWHAPWRPISPPGSARCWSSWTRWMSCSRRAPWTSSTSSPGPTPPAPRLCAWS